LTIPVGARLTGVRGKTPLALIVVAFVATIGCGRTVDESPWAITNVAVVDVANGRFDVAQTIHISGGRIMAVGPTASTSLPEHVRRIDGTGQFVLPGLFDMHTHLFGTDAELRRPRLERRLAAGVLGVRDLGAPLDSIAALAKDQTSASPAVWYSGPVLDVSRTGDPGIFHFVDDDSQARQAVSTLAGAGVQFIKVHDWMARSMYLAIAESAREHNLPLVGHVPAAVSIDDAIAAGQKSIEHLGGMHGVLRACSREDPRRHEDVVRLGSARDKGPAYVSAMSAAYLTPLLNSFDSTLCAALAGRLAGANVWQVPTLVLWRSFGDAPASTGDMSARRRLFATYQRIIGIMHRAGVRILAGTDETPDASLQDELELLVGAGLSPAAALRAATTGAAEFLGVEDSHGSVATGHIANLLVLDANPLTDIRNLRRIRSVVLLGQPLR
jgi:imidazolonepropionase-like amidohydrolase